MTISSIYVNQPGTAGKPGEMPIPELRESAADVLLSHKTLQEVTDQAKLSALAPKIRAMLSEMSKTGDNVLETLTDNVDKLQDGFIETLYTVLSKEHIDLSEKMTLRLNEDDAFVVIGEHPDKQQVENVLAQHPALSGAFREIAAQSELLRDIGNIDKVMARQTGAEAYYAASQGRLAPVYQMSLKGEMSHFYFARH